jgi:hypothetical protein
MSIFLDNFKAQKHLTKTLITKENSLTPKSIILMVKMNVDIVFLSLLLEFSNLLLISQTRDYKITKINYYNKIKLKKH